MNTYGKRLRQVLDERNMNQKDLVELTGISKSSISQYMSGNIIPPEDTQETIAVALGVYAGWFLEKNPLPKPKEDLTYVYEEKIKNFPVAQAAKVLGMAPENVRRGLIQGRVPWGYATETLPDKYTFHISFRALASYMGYSYEEMFS